MFLFLEMLSCIVYPGGYLRFNLPWARSQFCNCATPAFLQSMRLKLIRDKRGVKQANVMWFIHLVKLENLQQVRNSGIGTVWQSLFIPIVQEGSQTSKIHFWQKSQWIGGAMHEDLYPENRSQRMTFFCTWGVLAPEPKRLPDNEQMRHHSQ